MILRVIVGFPKEFPQGIKIAQVIGEDSEGQRYRLDILNVSPENAKMKKKRALKKRKTRKVKKSTLT